MIYIEQYNGEQKLLMMGFLAALIGSTIWNLIATVLGMPISGTHSIVGAIIGFSVVAKGFGSVQWTGLIKIGKCFVETIFGIFLKSNFLSFF